MEELKRAIDLDNQVVEDMINSISTKFLSRPVSVRNNRKTTRGRHVQHIVESEDVIADTDLGFTLHESKVFLSKPDPRTGTVVKTKCGKCKEKRFVTVYEKDDLIRTNLIGNRIIHIAKNEKDSNNSKEVSVSGSDGGESKA
jgi:hypothetical protein